jgi:hypothetical protein
MEIQKEDLCEKHINLKRACPNCQIHQFLMSDHLRKDIVKEVIFPYLKEGQKSWAFDIRATTYEEDHYDPYDDFVYGGMVFGDREDVQELMPDSYHPCYKFLFHGTKQAFMGFLCCFLIKYGVSMILPIEEYVIFGGLEGFEDEFLENFGSFGDLEGECIYEKSQGKAIVTISTDMDNFYFITDNVQEFLDGYREMLNFDIPNVYNSISDDEDSAYTGLVNITYESSFKKCIGDHIKCMANMSWIDPKNIKTLSKSKLFYIKI